MYPHTIDNGHGERLTFLGRDGDRLLVTSHVSPGAGPPMHVHRLQSETLRVESGRIGAEVRGEGETYAGPGEVLEFPAGVAHRFWNAGDDELVLTGWITPPDNIEFFLAAMFASTAAHGGRPGLFDAAYLTTRYRSEFEMTAIPSVVRRVLVPAVALLGRALGRYRHFSDAPAPAHRPTSATLPGRGTTRARSSAG